MREIEFLPDWYPVTRRRRRLVMLQGWLMVVIAAGMGSWMLLKDRNIARDEKALAAINAQVMQTDAQLAEMDKLEAMRRQWRKQDQILSRLGLYVEACSMVQTIDSLMPRQMSLVGIQLDNEEKADTSVVNLAKGAEVPVDRRLKVRVAGVCPTDVDLANFMTQLTTVPFFEQVSITFAREKSENNHLMREFEVSFCLNLNTGN